MSFALYIFYSLDAYHVIYPLFSKPMPSSIHMLYTFVKLSNDEFSCNSPRSLSSPFE